VPTSPTKNASTCADDRRPRSIFSRQLDRLEATAKAAAEYPGRHWKVANNTVFDDDGANPLMSLYNEHGELELAVHIATWDPATVLRHVDAHRKVLRELEDATGAWEETFHPGLSVEVGTLRRVVKLLAQGYGWTPESTCGSDEH